MITENIDAFELCGRHCLLGSSVDARRLSQSIVIEIKPSFRRSDIVLILIRIRMQSNLNVAVNKVQLSRLYFHGSLLFSKRKLENIKKYIIRWS